MDTSPAAAGTSASGRHSSPARVTVRGAAGERDESVSGSSRRSRDNDRLLASPGTLGSGAMLQKHAVSLAMVGWLAACSGQHDWSEGEAVELRALTRVLKPLMTPLRETRSGEWLDQHEEAGQTFAEYVTQDPVTARGERRVLYIQKIGDFSKTQERVIELTREYLALYFSLSVTVLPAIPVDDRWPEKARRTHPSWGDEQLLSTHILREVLRPRVKDDAAVLLGLTAWDLWPGRGWNFVFGQASLDRRVGVWSIHRNGDPDRDEASFVQFLRRTLKTATHEAGHAFSIHHCIAYECNMCGSNHREESDRHPLWLCAECVPKICLATGSRPVKRYQVLEAFCRRNGLDGEAAFFGRARAAVEQRGR